MTIVITSMGVQKGNCSPIEEQKGSYYVDDEIDNTSVGETRKVRPRGEEKYYNRYGKELKVGKPLYSMDKPAVMSRNVGKHFDSDSKYDKDMGNVERTIAKHGSVENYREMASRGEFVDDLKGLFARTWWLIIVVAVILVVNNLNRPSPTNDNKHYS